MNAATIWPRAAIGSLSKGGRSYFSTTTAAKADFTHAVIGGGVVGLAVARQLSRRSDTSTVLVERHGMVGTETSSRNSEVIHAGIYYPTGSLKSRLCIRGKELLYELCEARGVGHRRTGKWIVAQNDAQRAELDKIWERCRDELGVPVRWVGQEEIARDGEGVRAEAGALESPTTGIVDSHGLMACLEGLFEEAGGVIALNSRVEGVEPLGQGGSGGWKVDVADASTGEVSTITAETIVNAAGLGAVHIHNMIAPPDRHRQLYFAKGNYFSYAASRPRVTRLIYPAPEPGAGGLGTHLTLDLAGRLRFGPDVEWVDSPENLTAGGDRLATAVREIKRYLPGVDETLLEPDYAGIRPKLGPASSKAFYDFYIEKEAGYEGWVNLLGIESPGLTSSLAIGDLVEELMYGSASR